MFTSLLSLLARVPRPVALALALMALIPVSAVAQPVLSPAETARNYQHVALSAHGSMQGPGVGLHLPVTERLQLRLSYSRLPVSRSVTTVQNDIAVRADGTARLGGAAVRAAWFPFGGAFHLSAGTLIGTPSVTADVQPTSDYAYSPTKTFSPEKLGMLAVRIDYPTVRPTVGLGWGNALDSRWSLLVDLGLTYLGPPRVAMEGTGLIAPTARQAAALEAGLQSFRYLPTAGLALAYRL